MDKKILKFYVWLFFELCVPVMIVIAIWPIAAYVLGLTHSFERTLSSADLLPLSALILIGVVLETAFDESIPKDKNLLLLILTFASFLAFVFLFSYGFMRAESFGFDIIDIDKPNYDGRMTLFGKISLTAISISSVYAVMVKLAGWYYSAMENRE